ncbi:divergent PAP2 family protein [Cyanobium sp. Aljojuca 7D2]|uniref:divergent PAP2 family protein n=1 Tax=Cyanobium sp. Aljojuca 7D2 TaxID=2823698 RepID=UPI0020CEC69E|nr:divergent PAP2 family protein [Cyanobium sp. Aljojuca 7D2]MCP9890468.1 divergent PAP2 family protein [Cyanobium sp. Aljojuca 7D2]
MSTAVAGIFDNGVMWWGLAACGVAQLSKLVIELVVHRRWNPKVLVETGGMPSSHSALLTGTTAALGWVQGFDGPLFALAAVLCFVVLYDASGVRRAAGLTAARVNAMGDTAMGDTVMAPGDSAPKPLKENLGHTRLEVLIGALMGPLVALPGLVLLGSPLHLAQGLGWFTAVG